MTDQTLTQCVLFPNVYDKPVMAKFDEPMTSSDGGGVLLKAADKRLRLTDDLVACIKDGRQKGKIDHQVIEMLRQRIYGIACGYADCNDAARLRDDPLHKLLVGRDSEKGEALSSQPTLSRFENSIDRKELYRMGESLCRRVLDRHRRRLKKVKRVRIDLDSTDDPTHGNQQMSLFNAHYDSYCYLPMLGFVSFDGESDHYLVAAVLRPGNASTRQGAIGILWRLMREIRKRWRKAIIEVRLDGGFACPELFDFLEVMGVEYECGVAKNPVLEREAADLMEQARELSERSGKTEHVYGECQYKAKTWSQARRVIIKAEVTRTDGREPKDNPRFVITNRRQTARWVYEHQYCGRGEVENRIKELFEVEIDRTSATRFWTNQFRVLLSAAAYVLLQELRLQARDTELGRAQVSTLRLRLLKLGVRVVVSVRRIVLHLPQSYPDIDSWKRIADGLGAVS